jgi:hypothetical protein
MENSSIGFGNMSVCMIVKVKMWFQPKMDGSVEDNKHSISLQPNFIAIVINIAVVGTSTIPPPPPSH